MANAMVTASCQAVAAPALQMCIDTLNAAAGGCYFSGDTACEDNDADFAGALNGLRSEVENACADGDLFSLSVEAAVGRLQNSCKSQSDSIAWRPMMSKAKA